MHPPVRPSVPHPRALSHREIVALAAPFARRGHRVDMAASQRLDGRVVFTAREGDPGLPTEAARRETLTLECLASGLRLTRRTAAGPALEASAVVDGGDDPEELLCALDRLPPAAQCIEGDGFRAALRHRLRPGARGAGGRFVEACVRTRSPAREVELTLTVAAGPVAGAAASLGIAGRGAGSRADGDGARSATIELRATANGALGPEGTLPDDLFAVLGWAWSPLRRVGDAWRGSVRLGPGGAESRLHEAAEHLARTLAEPPQAFHARLAARRWRVLARRSVPLLAWTLVLLLAGFAPLLHEARAMLGPALPALLALPLLLLGAYLWRSESPRFEWPPFPKPLRAGAW